VKVGIGISFKVGFFVIACVLLALLLLSFLNEAAVGISTCEPFFEAVWVSDVSDDVLSSNCACWCGRIISEHEGEDGSIESIANFVSGFVITDGVFVTHTFAMGKADMFFEHEIFENKFRSQTLYATIAFRYFSPDVFYLQLQCENN